MVDRTHGETKLWESFIKGETAAFEEVYRRYYSLLYSYGIRMVGDRELVADTIQNLFVKLILNCRNLHLSLIHISEPTRLQRSSRMPSSA